MNKQHMTVLLQTDQGLQFFSPTRRWKEFWLLSLIAENAAVSQHRLGRAIGASSSMTNTYIRDFVRQGLLTVNGDTNRTMRYELTPGGKKMRRQLLHLYGREVARLHTAARQEYAKRLNELVEGGIKRLVLFGAATTGELVYQSAQQTALEIVAVVDNDSTKQGTPFGRLVVLAPSVIESFNPDGVLIAAFGRPDEIYQQIKHLKEKGIEIIRL
jgi:DNA-binding MarR family transcriptional regulator